MIFDAGEFELALQLIQIYLRLFRILIVNDKLNEHRLLPLLVAGLNRAFPYAKGFTQKWNYLIFDCFLRKGNGIRFIVGYGQSLCHFTNCKILNRNKCSTINFPNSFL
jgi:hypothetical protein